jgi:hypothetical protein
MARRSEQQAQLQRVLDDIEEQVEHLKVAYDRYFNGVDAVPPTRQHEVVKKAVRELERLHFTNTASRFRAGSLRSRLISYEQYWTRVLLQIENGTYQRLLAVSGRREREKHAARAAAAEAAERATGSTEAARTGPPPPPGQRRPPAALPDGVVAQEARDLFKAFVSAKRAAGEETAGLTYAALVEKLAREIPKLRQKHGVDVRFEVATVDGKVRLRARRAG